MKARIKNLITHKNIDYAFKSNESVEVLDVSCIEMEYLYKDPESLYFMDQQTYNQYALAASIVGDIARFMKEGNKYFVFL